MPLWRAPSIPSSEITPHGVYLKRRQFLLAAAAMGLVGAPAMARAAPLAGTPSKYTLSEAQTPLADVTSYNNFYEFGTGKDEPETNAQALTTTPWKLTIDGLVAKPMEIDVADLLSSVTLEERVYRMRCVEGWSMVIPWVGFSLGELLKRVEPLANAKFVAFQTLLRPEEMPGQAAYFPVLTWPYVEGLRLDEAMNPLAILAVGLYGETLPKQNGAPIRLVVPWKYGFKGIKSIVKISLVEQQPPTSWNLQSSSEYGFYSNVNPTVDHPRWSQATERRIGEGGGLLAARRPTLPFNGYADEVASLYAGMDLAKDF